MPEPETLSIKNMVCLRCILAVKKLLNDLSIPFHSVELGKVVLLEKIPKGQLQQFETRIRLLGFELLTPGKSALIEKIKTLIIKQIHYSDETLKVNLSVYLADHLHQEYSYLSRLFSSVEGITIEKFAVSQRIEKVKELLHYDEMNLSEIADHLQYSSVAHLSAQFKKETGMSPSTFKKQNNPHRIALDQLPAKS